MRVNWTKFDELGFKSGVTSPFIKYIRWISTSFCLLIQFTEPDCDPEDSKGGPSEAKKSILSETASNPSTVSSSTVPPKAIPSKIIPTCQKPGNYRKRTIVYMEDSSEEEEDVDIDKIKDNDSSGESVDSDHVPTKCLRTSIAMHSSRTTPASEGSITDVDIHQDSPSIVDNNNPALGNSNVGPGSRSEPEVLDANHGTPAPSLGNHVDSTKDVTLRTTPTPSNLDQVDMDVDAPTRSAMSVGVCHAHESADAPLVTPPQPVLPLSPEPELELKIPNFLKGKNDIYGHLSSVKEPGFQTLLKGYITFELTNHSCIRGMLSTTRRPNAIGWWSG